MNYAQARPLIKSGDLLAWTHRSWGSWHDIKVQIVRFFTQSEYSHVALAYEMDGRLFAYEAVMPLVRIFPLSKLGEFYHLPLNTNWTPEVRDYAMSHVGEEYSQVQAVLAMARPLEHDSKWECAELVLAVLEKAGVSLGTKAVPSAVVREAKLLGSIEVLVVNP